MTKKFPPISCRGIFFTYTAGNFLENSFVAIGVVGREILQRFFFAGINRVKHYVNNFFAVVAQAQIFFDLPVIARIGDVFRVKFFVAAEKVICVSPAEPLIWLMLSQVGVSV